MSGQFVIRNATPEEAVSVFKSVATTELWNPGHFDAVYFQRTYPKTFYVGELDGEVICCITSIPFNDIAFIGMYVVKPEYRKKGYGFKIFQHAMESVNVSNIALDAVLKEIGTYEKSGFIVHTFFQNRYGGKFDTDKYYKENEAIVPLNTIDSKQIAEYEKSVHGFYRPEIWDLWKTYEGGHSFGYLENGQLVGLGQIRPGVDAYKIGPIFAKNTPIAKELIINLIHAIPKGSSVQLDICSLNDEAIQLVQDFLQFNQMFQCKRLWLKEPPKQELNQIYASLSLEYG